jgi:hypothetical protein
MLIDLIVITCGTFMIFALTTLLTLKTANK